VYQHDSENEAVDFSYLASIMEDIGLNGLYVLGGWTRLGRTIVDGFEASGTGRTMAVVNTGPEARLYINGVPAGDPAPCLNELICRRLWRMLPGQRVSAGWNCDRRVVISPSWS
jgi:hypothetical protein